jgi:hemerythrin
MRAYDECRCYVDHLISEHRRLHRMLNQAHHAIVGAHQLKDDSTGQDVVSVLRQVRGELEHHFAQEEGGGCLDEAVSHCPALSVESHRIEAEHPQLLAGVDRLIAQALDSDQSLQKRIELEVGFDELRRQLDAHEAAENALLRKGFGANVNGENHNHTLPLDR